MSTFVDISVWSLAMRRDTPHLTPEVRRLRQALRGAEPLFTTGRVLQELLQGFRGPRARDAIVDRFAALPILRPERQDHVGAAELRNDCRRRGVLVGTIDALLTQLCIRFELTLLTADADFTRIAEHHALEVWRPQPPPMRDVRDRELRNEGLGLKTPSRVMNPDHFAMRASTRR